MTDDRSTSVDHGAAGLGVVALLMAAAGFYYSVVGLLYAAFGFMVIAFVLFYLRPVARFIERRSAASTEPTPPTPQV